MSLSEQDARRAARDLFPSWNAAAERAFGAGIHQPEIYLRLTRLAAAVVAELRAAGRGAGPLVAAWHERHELVGRVAGAEVAGLDVEVVAGAAFAMRYREVLSEITLDDRLAALAAAGPEAGWVVLEESGHAEGDPFVPYRRLEADPRTGRALLVTAVPDESFTRCVHTVEEGYIDLTTGALTQGGTPQEAASATEREELANRLKGR